MDCEIVVLRNQKISAIEPHEFVDFNNEEPEQHVEEPYTTTTAWVHQSGHALLWDDIPFFNQHLMQVSQHSYVWYKQPKMITEMFLQAGLTSLDPLFPMNNEHGGLEI